MREWRNHQVTADIRVQIEDDEIVSAPIKQEILFIVGGIFLRGAENARARLGHIGSARGDVSMSPGTPESFHNSLIRDGSSGAFRFASLQNLLRRTLVDEFLEFLAGFKIRNPLGGNINGGTGLGVSTPARTSLAHAKTAEAS